MEIREATESDIPGIVALLKVSLGEVLMPKSETYWRWKHLDNPFSPSPVLVALEGAGRVVGVRAFMRWRWIGKGKKVEAVRAVDTATHPDFQGKGIFSNLTKALLADCKEKGYQLVFNTPNNNSLAGYLKMGWEKAGKLPITARIANPLNGIKVKKTKGLMDFQVSSDDSLVKYLLHPGLPELISNFQKLNQEHYITGHSVEFLKWRYHKVPAAIYYAAGVEKNNALTGLIFYRLKNSRMGVELRITDALLKDREALNELQEMLVLKIAEHGADYATFAALSDYNPLRSFFSLTQRTIAPIVTIRAISNIDLQDFRGFKHWAPSLGDLELF